MRESFQTVATHYDQFTASPHHVRPWRLIMAMIRATLPDGASILDVACGTGAFAVPLARAGFRVTGLDYAPRMLDATTDRAAQARVVVKTVCRDVREPLNLEERFDAALSVHGPLSYARDPVPLIRRVAERVETGGQVWLGLHRAASAAQMVRRPVRSLLPMFSDAPQVVRGRLSGEPIDVYLHDPIRLAERLGPDLRVERVRASGVVAFADGVDSMLGDVPVLQRLGRTTVMQLRVMRAE